MPSRRSSTRRSRRPSHASSTSSSSSAQASRPKPDATSAARDITWEAFLERGARALGCAHARDGGERAGVHPRHVGHDRQAEAGGPHPWRLPGPHPQHGALVFGLKPTDVWWATSDIGWIVGHSYMVYAPLLAGCTTVAFEGALDHPHADANWRRSSRTASPASSPRPPPSAC